jgi:hypothetical protein
VPQPIADGAHAQPVVGRQDLAVGADVGDVGQGLVAEAVLGEHGDRGLAVQRAVEALGEGELLLVLERLVAKDQHRVFVHAGAQLRERVGVGQGAQADAGHLGAQHRREFLDV